MSETVPEPHPSRAREIARQAADEYLSALPFENAATTGLAETNLLLAVARINDALVEEDVRRGIDDREGTARRAGYILALEIGKRMAAGKR
jgi:hypothetical protein